MFVVADQCKSKENTVFVGVYLPQNAVGNQMKSNKGNLLTSVRAIICFCINVDFGNINTKIYLPIT